MRGLDSQEGAARLVHGVFIEYHPIWRGLADIYKATGIVSPIPPWNLRRDYNTLLIQGQRHQGPYDIAFLPSTWTNVCEDSNKSSSPFLVKVYVDPTTAVSRSLRRDLEQYVRTASLFVVLIDAPVGTLTAQITGGEEIVVPSQTSPSQGTVGGYLQDQHGDRWGVTCGHVAQQKQTTITLNDVKGAVLANAGTVIHTNYADIIAQGANGPCNGNVPAIANTLNVDAALFSPASAHSPSSIVHSLGTVDQIYDKADLNSGDPVSMSAAISGRADYVIGGYGFRASLKMPTTNDRYCFSDLFDFYDPGESDFWSAKLYQLKLTWPLPGDSGAWVCHRHSAQQYGYYGTLIATRGPSGIAMFAESMRQWAANQGLQLSPL